jgi:transcriptional regulator with XRE-family HTH domain
MAVGGELTALLRYRRAQVDPVDAGLPRRGGRGRRAVGLSQAQVAQLLFRTERWYGQFERGGVDAPPPELLEDVARVLRMNEQERAALYLYALGQEPPDRSAGGPEDGTAHDAGGVLPWEGLLDDVSPHPVAVTDVAWTVVAHNRGFAAFHRALGGGRAAGATPHGFNLLHWQLLCEEARDRQLLDWESGWARSAAARLRYSLARHPNNRRLRRIEQEVLADPRAEAVYRDCAHTFETERRLHPVRLDGWGSGRLAVLSMRPYGGSRTWLNIMVLEPEEPDEG